MSRAIERRRPDPGMADDGDALHFCSTCAFSSACLSHTVRQENVGHMGNELVILRLLKQQIELAGDVRVVRFLVWRG